MELLVTIVVILMLAGLAFLPLWPRQRPDHSMGRCVSHLKQVGLSFLMFAGDNNDRFPFEALGSPAESNMNEAWLHFQSLSNEMGSPKLLACPFDVRSKAKAEDFRQGTNAGPNSLSTLKNNAVSYFVALDAKPNGIVPHWLSGDRHVSIVGSPQTGPLLTASDRSRLRWPWQHHRGTPNVVLSDGSVALGTNHIVSQGWPSNSTNRLLLPQ